MIFFDTETAGFKGPCILIQWAEDDGPIHLHNVWKEPVKKTIELIEYIVNHPGGVCGFNLVFDWFHLTKIYTMLKMLPNPDWEPQDHIEKMKYIEAEARSLNLCLKPHGAVDLMIVAREGIYQNTMDRKPIVIKRVPTKLAPLLLAELEKRVEIPGLYFAKRKRASNERWVIKNIEDDMGNIIPEFKNLELSFAPSTALKALAADALGRDVIMFDDIETPLHVRFEEDEYVPFAGRVIDGVYVNMGGNWPEVIQWHIDKWAFHRLAKQYAEDDVTITRELYDYFERPAWNDNSMLACSIGTTRWVGFAVDKARLRIRARKAERAMQGVPLAPSRVRAYLEEVADDFQKETLRGTDKQILKLLHEKFPNHELGKRAMKVLRARQGAYNKNYFEKILRAGRFHVDLNPVGTKSNRMSGSGGLNAQGLTSDEYIRRAFTLADSDLGEILVGGDFDAFEPCIAATVYYDENLMAELRSGKKFHAVFGTFMYPDLTYEQIMESKDHKAVDSPYKMAKMSSLLTTYMGTAWSMANKTGTKEEDADAAQKYYKEAFPGVAKSQLEIAARFTALRQDGERGKITWSEPEEYIESIFGTRRYFTLEHNIMRVIFDLANDMPPEWKEMKFKVQRMPGREQTAFGATMTALFAAIFNMQSQNIRVAANHVVQSPGAMITKGLQAELWKEQPVGIHEFVIKMLNIHDEILATIKRELETRVQERVNGYITRTRKVVELLKIGWKRMKSWAK